MSPEDLILFACARQDFTPAHADAVQAICRQPVRWECVLASALEQSVAPLVFTNLLKTPLEPALPAEVAGKFSRQLWENIAVKAKTAMVLAQVFERFPHEDLLLVKSAALDRSVYDQPWYLWSFDVDLLFRRRRDQFDAAELAGLIAFLEKANRSIRPMDQHFEYEFFAHHDLCLNGILPVDFERVWRGAPKNPSNRAVEQTPIEDCSKRGGMPGTELPIGRRCVERGKAVGNQVGHLHAPLLQVIKEQADHFSGSPGRKLRTVQRSRERMNAKNRERMAYHARSQMLLAWGRSIP